MNRCTRRRPQSQKIRTTCHRLNNRQRTLDKGRLLRPNTFALCRAAVWPRLQRTVRRRCSPLPASPIQNGPLWLRPPRPAPPPRCRPCSKRHAVLGPNSTERDTGRAPPSKSPFFVVRGPVRRRGLQWSAWNTRERRGAKVPRGCMVVEKTAVREVNNRLSDGTLPRGRRAMKEQQLHRPCIIVCAPDARANLQSILIRVRAQPAHIHGDPSGACLR